jgi:hypothetical protein
VHREQTFPQSRLRRTTFNTASTLEFVLFDPKRNGAERIEPADPSGLGLVSSGSANWHKVDVSRIGPMVQHGPVCSIQDQTD